MSDWFITDNATKVQYNPAVAPESREFRNETYEEVVGAREGYPKLDPRLDAMVSGGAMQENGTGKFLAATNHLHITDPFITADTTVIINLDVLPEGFWSWESLVGSFIITSTVTESADIDFTWTALKKGA